MIKIYNGIEVEFKDEIESETKMVVYKITTKRGIYIGKTSRKLNVRIKDHCSFESKDIFHKTLFEEKRIKVNILKVCDTQKKLDGDEICCIKEYKQMGHNILNTTYNRYYNNNKNTIQLDILDDYVIFDKGWDNLKQSLTKINDFIRQLIEFIDNRRGDLTNLLYKKTDTSIITMLDYKLIKVVEDKTYINSLLNNELNSVCN